MFPFHAIAIAEIRRELFSKRMSIYRKVVSQWSIGRLMEHVNCNHFYDLLGVWIKEDMRKKQNVL